MKVSYLWLQEYIKSGHTAEQLAELFRLTSSEVESITDWEKRFEHIVIGEIIDLKKHPSADRLQVLLVSLGKEKRQIVTGAPNVALGQKVVVALPGAQVKSRQQETVIIQKATLRGESSEGMLCSAEELDLPLVTNDLDGILVLPETYKPGQSLVEAFNLRDKVLDLEITPNRPDLLSYRGLAREVSACEKKRLPELVISSFENKNLPSLLSITLEDSKLCSRFSAICLENCQVGPSPLWLQLRLILSGIKPINTIVDVTNYVMLEMGQPLHVYDLDILLAGKPHTSLIVRSAQAKEEIVTLGGQKQVLQSGDIVIARQDKEIINLAGILGSASSGINPQTKRIVIESATFLGSQIRRTSRRLGIRTEASTRFEKGLDPEQTVAAIKRAVFLLQEMQPEVQIGSTLVDHYPHARSERSRIHLSFARLQQVLGVNISAAETKTILQHLGFQIPSLTKSSLEIIPPSWRKDVTLPEDVMEELIRIWGFDRLPSTLPAGPVKAPQPNQFFQQKMVIRRLLSAQGLHETVHLSFTSAQLLEKSGFDLNQAIRLQLPLSSETEYLIPSHLVHFLENCSTLNQASTTLGLFEIGHIFLPPATEQEMLSLFLRTSQNGEELYRQVKSWLEFLCSTLQLPTLNTLLSESSLAYFLPGTTLDLQWHNQTLGRMGLLSPEIVHNFKIRNGTTILFVELNLDQLLALKPEPHFYQPPLTYPSIERDITLVVPVSLAAKKIEELLTQSLNPQLVYRWQVATIYRGKPLEKEQKSVTLHFTYNALTRTLQDTEVNDDQARLIELFRKDLSASITT